MAKPRPRWKQPRELEGEVRALLAGPLDDAALRARLEELAREPAFGGLTPVWGPALYRRNRVSFRAFLRDHLPALADAPLATAETCLYTVAPGEDFVVGPLPGRPEVIVASPCSGHGFKFAALIGRILADFAVDGSTSVDVADWRPASYSG